MFARLREPLRRRGAISIRHALSLALSSWTTPGLYSCIRFALGGGGCFRVGNVSDGNLREVACALNAAQNNAGYYVHSVLRPPRHPSPMRSRASASHCTTSRPPRGYRVSRYIVYFPSPLPGAIPLATGRWMATPARPSRGDCKDRIVGGSERRSKGAGHSRDRGRGRSRELLQAPPRPPGTSQRPTASLSRPPTTQRQLGNRYYYK